MNKLTFKLMNYSISLPLDTIINDMIKKGVDKIEETCYDLIIEGGDYTLKLWNTNKWYGWLSQGALSSKGVVIFEWNDVRPKRKTMVRLDNLISKFKYIK